jgi:hypothetical protein
MVILLNVFCSPSFTSIMILYALLCDIVMCLVTVLIGVFLCDQKKLWMKIFIYGNNILIR